MLKFLREHELIAAFAAARKRDKQARIAVAFWGQGAAKKLSLRKGDDVQVICNLDHIGCNPKAIRELRDLQIPVKTHPRLHGKVYATRKTAIIGSSNASTNGLAVEGDAAVGWKEANLMSSDANVVSDALVFFDELWEDVETRTVTQVEIDAAVERRKAIPPGVLNPPNAKTLIAACRERPDAFSNVIVYAYDQGLSAPAKKAFAEFKEQAVEPEPGTGRPNLKKSWGYGTSGFPIGHWIVDLDCKSKNQLPRVWGCSQFNGVELNLQDDEVVAITQRGVISIGGLRFTLAKKEKAFLAAAGRQILKAGREEFVSLEQAIRIADRVASGSKGKRLP